MKKISFAGLMSLLVLFVSCQQPVTPGDGITISQEGINESKSLIYILKVLKTYHDIVNPLEQYSLDKEMLDSVALTTSAFQFKDFSSVLSGSLAKGTVNSNKAVSLFGEGIAKSLGTASLDTLQRNYDFENSPDTVYSFVKGDTVKLSHIRVLHSSLLVSPWKYGYDSINYHFAKNDTSFKDTLFDTLYRFRFTADTLVKDIQMYTFSKPKFNLLRRTQIHYSQDKKQIYFRNSLLSLSAQKKTISDSITANQTTWIIEREDNSSNWWNSITNSSISKYQETTDSAGTKTIRTYQNAAGGAIVLQGSPSTQKILIQTTISNVNVLESYSSIQSIADKKIDSLKIQKIFNPGRSYADTAKYIIRNLNRDSGTCILDITHIPSSSVLAPSLFATRLNSSYLYYCKFTNDFSSFSVKYVYRNDDIRGDTIKKMYWSYYPKNPFLLDGVPDMDSGIISVSIPHTNWDSYTTAEIFEMNFTNESVTYIKNWVGKSNDTLRLEIVKKSGSPNFTYSVSKPSILINRRGAVNYSNNTITVFDSLIHGKARYCKAVLDTNLRGHIEVTGYNNFTIDYIKDSLQVTFNDESFPWKNKVFNFSFVNRALQGTIPVTEESRQIAYSFTINKAGVIKGEYKSTGGALDSTKALAVNINPYFVGSAMLYGIFVGDYNRTKVHETISIDLWKNTWLGNNFID